MLPKIILVPTDFGDVSEAALDTALEYAAVFNADVVLMHAYEIPIIGLPDGAVVATAELTSRIVEGAQLGLDRQIEVRSSTLGGKKLRGIIKQGSPWEMVNETASEIGAGLIVMGTHGRHGIPRILIGSVAEKVVRTAHVPVLTVHLADVGRSTSRSQGKPSRSVEPAAAMDAKARPTTANRVGGAQGERDQPNPEPSHR